MRPVRYHTRRGRVGCWTGLQDESRYTSGGWEDCVCYAEIFKTWDLKKRALDRPGGPGQGSDASRLRPTAAYK